MMRLLGNWVALISSSDSRPFKCSRNTLVRLSYSYALASLCLTFSGCADLKVKQPASDSTLPSLVWNVLNSKTGDQADYAGSPTINVKLGESYRVTLKANDAEGVKSIQIDGGMSWHCILSGTNRESNGVADMKSMTQDLAPDSDGMVLTSIFLIYDDLNIVMDCPGNLSFADGGVALTGRASNYFGGIRKEVITFVVVP